ncbi:Integral membrane protein GPR180-like protein [Dinothrombium tinctorium]|uniref:Integral membrane protein GPR180-like protein n=1 Tax=Dinothrombium tinctorium TaxID=1965070 RepID=A0A3S4QJ45_9ACAR|nr:Integral membrane protein GPR180-like protein [Dinothrombium tinctorium]RWS04356.1 Integral membrane protein GPR180-like protein [Dinothrombium tinctorium]
MTAYIISVLGDELIFIRQRSSLHSLVTFFVFTALLIEPIAGLNVNGVWSPSNDGFAIIGRFGFGKADIHRKTDSYGYIFGNITSASHPLDTQRKASLVLLSRDTFLRLYGPESDQSVNHSSLCGSFVAEIDKYAYDAKCKGDNDRDILRYAPCKKGGLCEGGFASSNPLVSGYQFTFVIQDQRQPTFWYLLLIACVRDGGNASSCEWRNTSKDNSVISYDIWFVNGNPVTASSNIFTYQFSYEQQDTILYLVMIFLYAILTTMQLYAFIRQKRRNLLVYLFTTSLSMHCLAFFFITLHKLVFAGDGVGYATLAVIADVIKIISMGFFILFVLIIAKGWPVTRSQVTAKPLLIVSWVVYIVIEIFLYIWAKRSQDVIMEIDEYHTIPGWFSLGFRIILMIWFLFELRATMMLEQDQEKLRFYLHFGAGIMVWFVHLPIVAIIGLQISLMWRYKLILGFSFGANFLAYAVVTHFMWPTRKSNRFLTHFVDSDYSEELDYYEETQCESLGRLTPNDNLNGINGRVNHFAYDNQLHHIK